MSSPDATLKILYDQMAELLVVQAKVAVIGDRRAVWQCEIALGWWFATLHVHENRPIDARRQ